MAPYAICHLKLALEISGLDAGFELPQGERLNVFLTNSLEEAHEAVSGPMFGAEIAREAQEADAVKRDKPVMVVLGNPPYSGHSANKGAWIRGLIEDYKRGVTGLKKPAQAKWLSDDYVKFIRFAQWRISQTGEGVLAFVTNHNYLDALTFRGMRRSLSAAFDEIYLLDLHGSVKKNERAPDGGPDKNVFDIEQGVAIGIFVKYADSSDTPARVFHADLWGEREVGDEGGKYRWLTANDIATTDWRELVPQAPQYLFVPRDRSLSGEYDLSWSVEDIFSPSGSPAPGIVTTHDKFAISWSRDESRSKVDRFLSTNSEEEARSLWKLCSQDQWRYERAKRELRSGEWRDKIQAILYRPFDTRVTVLDRNVAVHRRERVMHHMLVGPNLGLIACRQQSQMGTWRHCGVTRMIIESGAISNKTREINYLFPLYRYPSGQDGMELGIEQRTPNLAPEFTEALAMAIKLTFKSDGAGDLNTTFGPEDVFHYLYAILHSPQYRHRYAEFLKSDFPHIPLPGSGGLFAELVGLGARLTSLHLMEETGADTPVFAIDGDNRVGRVSYTEPAGETPGARLDQQDAALRGGCAGDVGLHDRRIPASREVAEGPEGPHALLRRH